MGRPSIVAASLAGHLVPGTQRGRLMILMYHRVHRQPDLLFPNAVDASLFETQVAMVRRYCHPVTLKDGVSRLRDGTLPSRAVAITFDDGYRDNFEVALPILKQYGMPATFFVSSGFIEGGRMWNDSVIEAIRVSPAEHVDVGELGLGRLHLGTIEQRRQAVDAVIRSVKHHHPVERQQLVDAFCSRLGQELPDNLMMSRAQVHALAHAGMEIGGHTVNHPILKTLEADEASQEIAQGRADLEEITNSEVCSFAYPNGKLGSDYTIRDREIVRNLGFRRAVSTNPGVASGDSDCWQLPRFSPWDRRPDRWLMRLLLHFSHPA